MDRCSREIGCVDQRQQPPALAHLGNLVNGLNFCSSSSTKRSACLRLVSAMNAYVIEPKTKALTQGDDLRAHAPAV